MINKNNKIYTCPAFAREVVDKIGAGDALLSLLSMCKKNKVDDYLSIFLSSLAAAQSVESIGNSKPLDKNLILKSTKHMLM
jgi:bifunctional ADP-heptose synthase (sugar kinase/adenylyltransferase)